MPRTPAPVRSASWPPTRRPHRRSAGLPALGRAGGDARRPGAEECLPLPAGSELFLLPGREPLGDRRPHRAGSPRSPGAIRRGRLPGAGAHADGSPRRTGRSAGRRGCRCSPTRPSAGTGDAPGSPPCASTPTGARTSGSSTAARSRGAPARSRRHAGNRLWQHLLGCALCSGCPAARNLVLGRWEAPLPTSPGLQRPLPGLPVASAARDPAVPATQERIAFTPTVEEILEIAVPHLERRRGRWPASARGARGSRCWSRR